MLKSKPRGKLAMIFDDVKIAQLNLFVSMSSRDSMHDHED
jgi:hypothetical protein